MVGGAGVLRGSGVLLVSAVWLSAFLFGLYILAFFVGAVVAGDLQRWNQGPLAHLYAADRLAANIGIGLHFAAGGLILMLGSIQLTAPLRRRFPAFHRWTGRVYIAACVLTAVGGLVYIGMRGTIGGTVMDLGFGLYGVAMLICAFATLRYAIERRVDRHREWAVRLFALAIGSWLYRIEYGFWFLFTRGLGHQQDFSGPFDLVMVFFFWLPNLLVAELYLRARRDRQGSALLNYGVASGLLIATLLVLAGTYFFTRHVWGGPILRLFGALA